MKVLLGENANQYNTAVSNYTERLQPLQTALDAYLALGIATMPTMAELAELQETPRAFLVKMMTNRQPLSLVGGITVSGDKFYELLDKPAGGDEFVKMVSTLFGYDGFTTKRVSVADCELVNGELRLTQTVKDALREQSRFYATTQAQMDEWTQVQAIVTALNTIRQYSRFGNTFDTRQYLGKVLQREGYAAGGNPIEANVQAVLNRA